MRSVRSYDAVTSSWPVGENCTSITAATWSLRTLSARDMLRESKINASWFSDASAKLYASIGFHATALQAKLSTVRATGVDVRTS